MLAQILPNFFNALSSKLVDVFQTRRGQFGVVLIVLALAGCSKQDNPANAPGAGTPGAAPPAVPVSVLSVQPTQVPITLEVVGQIEGAKETEVRARVSGIVQKKLYNEGSRVKAGQALFQLDRASFEIVLSQARAQLAEQQAKVQQTQREVIRLKPLVAQQAVSGKEYDDAVTAQALAKANLAAAQAKVKEAQLNLSYTTVNAPISGVTGRALKSEGNLINTGNDSLLTTISQLDSVWVRFSLADSELAKLPKSSATQQFDSKAIQRIELIFPDGKVYQQTGSLNFSASQFDPKLGTVALRAAFDNSSLQLLPGQFVRIRLTVGEHQGVFRVPQTAVIPTDQGTIVFVFKDGKALPRPVKAGNWIEKDWVILSGLQTNDQVIVDNLIKMRPGAAVVIQPVQNAKSQETKQETKSEPQKEKSK